jgi:dipeptidyl aminopeptidase/acylaminoacyl peptidase
MQSLPPHPRDDTITYLHGMPETQHPKPDRECGPYSMLFQDQAVLEEDWVIPPPVTQTLRLSSTSARPRWLSMRQKGRSVSLNSQGIWTPGREDWEERKDRDKTKRYAQTLTFINDPSQGGPRWETSQINFTVGVRGTIRKDTFFNKLSNLGVSEFKNRESSPSVCCQILESANSKTGKAARQCGAARQCAGYPKKGGTTHSGNPRPSIEEPLPSQILIHAQNKTNFS